MRNACLAGTFLICLLLSHAYARSVCMRERKEKEAEGPASATGRREAAGKIRCWMTKYRRGGMTEEQLWKPIGCGNDRLEC